MANLKLHELKDVKEFSGKSDGNNNIFTLETSDDGLLVNGEVAELLLVPDLMSDYEDIMLSCSRLIYKHDGYIFKIDVSKLQLRQQGRAEVDMYFNLIDEEDRQYFPEPVDWGEIDNCFWIAQEFLDLEYPKDKSKIVEYLWQKYELRDIINDSKLTAWRGEIAYNWALNNGQPIIFDYGR